MKNSSRSYLTSQTHGVELIKKCVVCGATLLVAEGEAAKDRHAICGWTDAQFDAFLARSERFVLGGDE